MRTLAGLAAFALAALAAFALTPLAVRLALRTGFLDRPFGYKGHASPTPYLGGLALAASIALAALTFGEITSTYSVLLGCALVLCALGTVDDRLNLSPLSRVVVEVAVALLLWSTGHGWGVLGNGPADAGLTVLWIVGIVNAFNLMDNMNGAAATCAAVSALGAAGLALTAGETPLFGLCLAIAGACAGFLPFNLARPSRIFMGDGGSMLLGSLVAGVAMSAASLGGRHPAALVVASLLVALAILDTTLVSISRHRAGRPLLSGGRDHLTHRLARRLGAAERVPPALAAAQALLCGLAVASVQAGTHWIVAAGAVTAAAGLWAVGRLEGPAYFAVPAESPGPGDGAPDGYRRGMPAGATPPAYAPVELLPTADEQPAPVAAYVSPAG